MTVAVQENNVGGDEPANAESRNEGFFAGGRDGGCLVLLLIGEWNYSERCSGT